MLHRRFLSLLFLFCIIIIIIAQVQGQNVTTLIGLLETPDFRLLNKLVSDTNLSSELERLGTEAQTLFAPNNEAFKNAARSFGSLDVGENETYTAVVNVLNAASEGQINAISRTVILYHVVSAKDDTLINSSKILTTQSDDVLKATGTGELESFAADNAKIVSEQPSDLGNWLVYTIDNILLPFLVTNTTKENAAKSTSPAVGAGAGTDVGGAASTNTGATTPPPATGTAVGGTDGNAVDVNTGGGSVCFPADAQVELSDGRTLNIGEVVPGDLILVDVAVRNSVCANKFSAVYGFTHRKPGGLHAFFRISTSHNFTVTLSGAHYVYVDNVAVPAKSVRVGDILDTKYGKSKVLATTRVMRRGLFAPHTLHGDIVVNGVVASCYTDLIPRDSAHAALGPVRALVQLGISEEPLGNLFYDGWPQLSFSFSSAISTGLYARFLGVCHKLGVVSYFSKELLHPKLN